MEQYERNLSRSQTLESFLVVNYLGNQLIRNHLQQATPKNSYRIVVLIVTLRWKIVKLQLEALLLRRLISVLKNMDLVEKKWLEYTEKQKPITVENKLEDPVQWTTTDWVAAVPDTPKPPADCCSQGMTLRTGISKTTKKPFYGYVCLGNIKEHAKWASQTSTGAWYFKDKE
jgi:hypothetical protein